MESLPEQATEISENRDPNQVISQPEKVIQEKTAERCAKIEDEDEDDEQKMDDQETKLW